MTGWGESIENLPASEEPPFPIFFGKELHVFFKLHAKGRGRGEAARNLPFCKYRAFTSAATH
jgi:hypothetical protein